MIIGVPKEIKNNENRVGMTPSGVAEVVKQGHRVFIQHTAGINSGFPDEAYQAVVQSANRIVSNIKSNCFL